MKTLLVAINAKYIHSNLAVYSIYEYAMARMKQEDCDKVAMHEYTINNQMDSIVRDIYLKKPDVIFFSCYIWNIEYVNDIARELKKLLPKIHIWFGGPEVSFEKGDLFKKYPYIKGIMLGEGEETAYKLLCLYNESNSCDEAVLDDYLANIEGIMFCGKGSYVTTPPQQLLDLDTLPFVYNDFTKFKNRIIYYESSRGCPFNCSYCMSSIDKSVRFRNVELVKKEMQIFLDNRVPQVKFIDRTFNISEKRTLEILQYLYDNDNGLTNFHFEIAADLISDAQIELMAKMRPGLIQLEIGVQSTNELTIKTIHRKMEFAKVAKIVEKLSRPGNIHIHLDLIAGLPYEDLTSFRTSFNQVYALKPGELQLGFLKVLKGANIHENADEYGIVYGDKAPYEVERTNWISFDDVIRLKCIEEMVEVYYNSGLFAYTMDILEEYFKDAYDMYESLAKYYEDNKLFDIKHSRITRYEILQQFINYSLEAVDCHIVETISQVLVFDLFLRENLKTRPGFAMDQNVYKEATRDYYRYKSKEFTGKDYHIEPFTIDVNMLVSDKMLVKGESMVLFDYGNRHPVTQRAAVIFLEKV